MPLELSRAEVIDALCRRYPAYTPEAAAVAPMWVLADLTILHLAHGDA